VSATSNPITLADQIRTTGDPDERVTVFTYDRNGRRLTEFRLNVAASIADGSTGFVASEPTLQTSTITFTYDGLGRMLSRLEANGVDQTDFTYDKLGRLITQTDPGPTDEFGGSVRRRTTTTYDGLSHVVKSRSVGFDGTAEVAPASAHLVTYAYAGGLLSSMTSAIDATKSFTRRYSYDADGHVVLESYDRLKADGTTVTEGANSRYDRSGRLAVQMTRTKTDTGWLDGEFTQVIYDGAGRMVARGRSVPDSDLQEHFDYDLQGRLWRSTGQDGVTRVYLHDENGNRTAEISSSGAGVDLSTLTLVQVIDLATMNSTVAIGSAAIAGINITLTAYDVRNLSIQTNDAKRLGDVSLPAADLLHSRAYNAFGDLISQTDALGNVTTYAYNTLGKLVQKTLPSVTHVDRMGVSHTTTTSEGWRHDISGRNIAYIDAEGNMSTKVLLAGTGYNGQDP